MKVRNIGVAVRSVHANTSYEVSFGKLAFARSATGTPIKLVAKDHVATAGEELELNWQAAVGSIAGRTTPIELTIERDENVYLQATTQARQVGRQVEIDPVTVRLPRGMPSGEYKIFADTRRLPVTGQPARRVLAGGVRTGLLRPRLVLTGRVTARGVLPGVLLLAGIAPVV